MGQQAITFQIIVKDDGGGRAKNRIENFLGKWFHEDLDSAPPYGVGSLLWWGITREQTVNSEEVQKPDTINIMRSRERAYGFSISPDIYHIYKDDPDPDYPHDGDARCGAPMIQFAPEEPPEFRVCMQCLVRDQAQLPERMKQMLPLNWFVWSENPHGTNWKLRDAYDQGDDKDPIDRYLAVYESAEGFRCHYFFYGGHWAIGAN